MGAVFPPLIINNDQVETSFKTRSKRVMLAGSYQNLSSTGLPIWILCGARRKKRWGPQKGSIATYQELKSTFPQAMMNEKEMGRHLVNIPISNSHCTEDLELTFIPNQTTKCCISKSETRIHVGWRKCGTTKTMSRRDEMSMAVRILKMPKLQLPNQQALS